MSERFITMQAVQEKDEWTSCYCPREEIIIECYVKQDVGKVS